jgi:hypothetical protein
MADKLMGSKNSQWAQIGLSHPIASTFKNRTSNLTTKVFKRACKANPRKNFNFFSNALNKKLKHPSLGYSGLK